MGTNIKNINYKESTSFSWNVIQSYYALYEFNNTIVSSYNGDLNSEIHRVPASIFNSNVAGGLCDKILFYPFNLSSESKKNCYLFPDYLIKNQYSKYPRDGKQTIVDIESNLLDTYSWLKHNQKSGKNQKVSLIDFMFKFRVWANYTGIDTILKIEDGGYLRFLNKNLGMITFFYAAFAELCTLALVGEAKFVDLVNKISNEYILKNPKLADNRFLIPLFIRLRIYKQMGFIKTDIPYLFPPLNDPVTLL